MNMPLRVLYIYGGTMLRGGMEAYMMNYYRHLDKSKVQIDFLIHGHEKGVYDDEIRGLGGKVYNITPRSENYFKSISEMNKILKSGNYKVIHSHMDAANIYALREARKCNIPIRISHSHNTQYLTKNKLKILNLDYCRKKLNKYATHYFACSKAAGDWLYQLSKIQDNQIQVIPNAISFSDFAYNENIRAEMRKSLDIENDFVVGHVGRFDYQKNQLFLLDVFAEIRKIKSNAKLVIVGDGKLKADIVAKIKELHLEKYVLLLGSRNDVPKLFNAFDIFLLPSLFEGLPVVLVEAQANGLPCFTSNNVTVECNIINKVSFLNLDDSPSAWAKSIDSTLKINKQERFISADQFKNTGYDITSAAEELQNTYLKFGGE